MAIPAEIQAFADSTDPAKEAGLPQIAKGPKFDLSLSQVDLPSADLTIAPEAPSGRVKGPDESAGFQEAKPVGLDISVGAPGPDMVVGANEDQKALADWLDSTANAEKDAKRDRASSIRAWYEAGGQLPDEWKRQIAADTTQPGSEQLKSAAKGIGEGVVGAFSHPIKNILKPAWKTFVQTPASALEESMPGQPTGAADAGFVYGLGKGTADLAKLGSGLVRVGASTFSDPVDATLRDMDRKNAISLADKFAKNTITDYWADPDLAPAAQEVGELVAQAGPVGKVGKPLFEALEGAVGRASAYAVKTAAPTIVGRSLQALGKSEAPLMAGYAALHGHPIGALAVLAARYLPEEAALPLRLQGIRHVLSQASGEALDNLGRTIANSAGADNTMAFVRQNIRDEADRIAANSAKLKQQFAGKIDNVDDLNFKFEDLNPTEQRIRKMDDQVRDLKGKYQKWRGAEAFNQYISNASQTGLNIAGLTVIPSTAFAGLASMAGQPAYAEDTAREATEAGIGFMAPFSPFGARSARLTALGEDLARTGKARMGFDDMHNKGMSSLSQEDAKQINILNGVLSRTARAMHVYDNPDFARAYEADGGQVRRGPDGEILGMPSGFVDRHGNGVFRAERVKTSGVQNHEFTHLVDELAGNAATEAYKNGLDAIKNPRLTQAIQGFLKTYNERARAGDPSYKNLSDDAILSEGAAELGRYILQSTPLEQFYGGGTIIDYLGNKIGRLTDRIKSGDQIKTIPGFNAPFTQAQYRDLIDAFYQAGGKFQSGDFVETPEGPTRVQEPTGMRDDVRKGLRKINVKGQAAEDAISAAFKHMVSKGEEPNADKLFTYASRIAKGATPDFTDDEINAEVQKKVASGMPEDQAIDETASKLMPEDEHNAVIEARMKDLRDKGKHEEARLLSRQLKYSGHGAAIAAARRALMYGDTESPDFPDPGIPPEVVPPNLSRQDAEAIHRTLLSVPKMMPDVVPDTPEFKKWSRGARVVLDAGAPDRTRHVDLRTISDPDGQWYVLNSHEQYLTDPNTDKFGDIKSQGAVGFGSQEEAQVAADRVSGYVEAQNKRAPEFATGEPVVVGAYHGTPSGEFDEFSREKLGTLTSADSAKEGFFFAGKPQTARNYMAAPGTAMLPYKSFHEMPYVRQIEMTEAVRDYMRYNDPSKFRDRGPSKMETVQWAKEHPDEIETIGKRYSKSFTQEPGPTSHMHEVYVRMENPYVEDFAGQGWRENAYMNAIDEAKAKGHDGVIFKNTYDGGGQPDNVFVAFDPKQIKSTENIGTFREDTANLKLMPEAPNTPEFKKFFGESKVKDEKGKPLPVFHGTSYAFKAFNPKKLGGVTKRSDTRLGFFFSEDPETATYFANYAANLKSGRERGEMEGTAGYGYGTEPKGQNVVPAFLSIKNPKEYNIERDGWDTPLADAKPFRDFGVQDLISGRLSNETVSALKQHLIDQGHDGIVIDTGVGNSFLNDLKNRPGLRDRAFVAFKPTQIKSAIGNKTFDTRKADIALMPDVPEAVSRAAIRRKADGQVFPAKYQNQFHWAIPSEYPELADWFGQHQDALYDNGFIDNRGNFLDREQAFSRMTSLGQLPKDHPLEYKNELNVTAMKQAGPVVSQSMREYPDTKLMPEVPGLEDLEKEKAYWNNRMSPLASLRGKINKQEFHDAFDKVLSLNEQIHKAIEKAGIPREIGVIGSGPGGLTLAINGPQEAYDTVLLDAATSTGGQARYSAWLQNITGFKGGTTGYNYYQETFNNARRMGAQFKLGNRATELNRDPNTGIYYVKSANGQITPMRAAVISTGLRPRILDQYPKGSVENLTYDNALKLAKDSTKGTAVIFGGANSASQAATGAATATANKVYLISRSPLIKGMSPSEIKGLENNPKVQILQGPGKEMDHLIIRQGKAIGAVLKDGTMIPTDAVGMFYGGIPNTEWLPKELLTTKDEGTAGLVRVDRGTMQAMDAQGNIWPGLYAIGDARATLDPETGLYKSAGRIKDAEGDAKDAFRHVKSYLQAYKENRQLMPEVNIGLDTPQGQKLKPQDVIDALRDSGVEATNYKVLQGDAGPTFVGTLNKHLNPYEANAVAEALGQESIAQHMGGGIGDVFGPEKEKWGNFDPTRFIQPNGKSVEENLQKAGLRQMPDETPFWPPEINRPRQEKKQEMRTPGGGYLSAEEAARGPEFPKPPMRTPGGLYLEPGEQIPDPFAKPEMRTPGGGYLSAEEAAKPFKVPEEAPFWPPGVRSVPDTLKELPPYEPREEPTEPFWPPGATRPRNTTEQMSLPEKAEGAVKKLMPDLEMFREDAKQQTLEKKEPKTPAPAKKENPQEAEARARLMGTTISMMPDVPSDLEVIDALKGPQKDRFGAHWGLPPGTPVGLRIDVPTYNRTGKYAITVHDGLTGGVGRVLGYDTIAAVNNPTFYSNETGSQKIREGQNKFPVATVKGQFDPARTLPQDIDTYTKVGFNPERHSFFYDKDTGQPVVGGDRAISTGNTVFVKNPEYGEPRQFKYMPDVSKPIEKVKSAGAFIAQTAVPALTLHKKEPREADIFASEQHDLQSRVAEARILRMPDEGTIGKAIKNVQRASENSEEEFFGKAWPKLLKATGLLVSPKKDSDVELAAQRAVKDVSEFVKENPKFSDYYDADLKAARDIIGKNLGKPLSDDEFKMFQLANGLFSNRTPLVSNTRESIETVKLLRNNGNLDGFSTYENPLTGSRKVGDTPFSVSGASAPNKIMAINGINKLLKEQGSVGAVVDYLKEEVPMKELNEFNKSLGYKGNVTDPGAIKEAVRFATGQDEKIPRMFAFGKKVGAYTLNNLGDSRYNTVDVWESRFIKSYFKGMLEQNTNIAHGIDEHAIFSRFVNKFNDYYRSEIDPNAPSSAMQAARWFYIMDAVKKAGYTRVMSQKTISQYAQRYFDENPPKQTP